MIVFTAKGGSVCAHLKVNHVYIMYILRVYLLYVMNDMQIHFAYTFNANLTFALKSSGVNNLRVHIAYCILIISHFQEDEILRLTYFFVIIFAYY